MGIDAPLDATAHGIGRGLNHRSDQHVFRRVRGLQENLIDRSGASFTRFPLHLLHTFIAAIRLATAIVVRDDEIGIALLNRAHQAWVIDHFILRAILEIFIEPQSIETIAIAVDQFGKEIIDPIIVRFGDRLKGMAIEHRGNAAFFASIKQIA